MKINAIATSKCLAWMLILASSVATAHHSPSKYDLGKSAQIVGVVTKYEWKNPHVYIFLEQTEEGGKTVQWEIEGGPPSMMRRMGWSTETLHVGDVLSVTGAPSKKAGDKSLIAVSVKSASNTLFDFALMQRKFEAESAEKFPAKDLAGVWLALPTMQIIVESTLPDPSKLTSRGIQLLSEFDETKSPAANCIGQAPPLSMLMPELKQITIGKDTIQLRTEGEDSVRIVHMNVSTHDGAAPSRLGHSIGQWEGTTLVIDSKQFAHHQLGNGYGVPNTSKKHVIERIVLNPDGVSLTYSFELHDPEILLIPRKGTVRWAFRPDRKFAPEKCDLDNARRFIK